MLQLPAVGKKGPGIWSVPVPIPDNPLGYTLVYVLESDDGPYLVDSGWDDPSSLAALTEGLTAVGTSITEIRGVLVTHHHPDHHGLSGHVREASGAWIALHRLDAAIVEVPITVGRLRENRVRLLRTAGAPEQEGGTALPDGPESAFARKPQARADRVLEGDELVEVPGRTVKAVWTPGHSPGHTCFHLEDSGTLLAGDHLLPRITPHVGLYTLDNPDADPLGDYLDSLRRVAKLRVHLVLPAHEHSFDDAGARAEDIRTHHEQRLTRILECLGDGELTLWEIAAGMEWNRAWEDIPAMMQPAALAEAGAHVRHLYARGRVEPVIDDDGPWLFRRA